VSNECCLVLSIYNGAPYFTILLRPYIGKMKTKPLSRIRLRYVYLVTTKWVSVEKCEDLRDLYKFSLKKEIESKTASADSRF